MTTDRLLREAAACHQSGRWREAARLYRQVLRQAPHHFPARQLLAMLYFQQGRHFDALAEIDRALALRPDAAEALAIKGNIFLTLDRLPEALASFDRARALKPDYLEALYNRGNCLFALGRFEDAIQSYSEALQRKWDYEAALTNRGNAFAALKLWPQALQDYDAAARLKPGDALAHYNRGRALHGLKRLQDALCAYDLALEKNDSDARAWNNRGSVLAELKRSDEALQSYDRAVTLDPKLAAAWNNRGNCLGRLERRAEALKDYERALALDAGLAEAWNNRGGLLRDLRHLDEALASFDKAIALKPDYATALFNRAALQWSELGHYEAARADLEQAARLDPDHDYAQGQLLHLRMYAGDWRDFENLKSLVTRDVRSGKKAIDPFAYQAISDSLQDLKSCAQIFTADRYPPMPSPTAGSSSERIRLGYVSGEFRAQATAYLAAGLYERHDRKNFEVIAFDNGENDESPMRKRLESAFDCFIDISRLSDSEAAAKIAREGIDILVNLNGYFGRHRMGVFARKPAPVQVNYLGFPGTLGAPYMDYILADACVIPESEAEFYAEKVVWLPDSYQVNDRGWRIAADAKNRDAHGLPAQGFVFCNFNQSYKLTPQMFETWMRILRKTEPSVLWLWRNNEEFPVGLKEEAEKHGVSGQRLIFAERIDHEQHLARLSHAGLALDSLPYGAHTTASDVLWAGVPLLTCRGRTFPGRVGASLLSAIGLPELIAEDLDTYEALAARLAEDQARLKAIKDKLGQNRLTYPLFDTDGFCRHIEAAYRRMHEMARRGEAPHSFHVQA